MKYSFYKYVLWCIYNDDDIEFRRDYNVLE